jgi:TolB-like protein/DNA-binding SARP family transcriptional activator
MKPVSIKFFGRCELSSPNGDGQVLINSTTAVLLARLALQPGQSQDRRRLTELLWPDRGEAQSLASLRQSLWVLRKAVGELDPPPIIADRSSIRMDPAGVDVDTVVFEKLLRNGTRNDLERAVEIYRGDYLAELDLDDLESQGPLLFERQRLRDLHLAGLKSLIGLLAESGDVEGAIAIAQRSLTLDPLQEDVHAAVIRLLRDAGRLGAAHKQYDACCAIFRRELDIPPPAEIEVLRKSLGTALFAPSATTSPALGASALPLSKTEAVPRGRKGVRLPIYLVGVAAVAAVVTLLLIFDWLQAPSSGLPLHGAVADARPSVVILPFRNAGTGGPQSAFATGLTDHLITDLSRVSGLFVIAAETSHSTAGSDVPPQQQAARLGVDYAVSGTVKRVARGVSVTVDMIEARTGAVIWTRRYERQESEIFAVQDDIVRRIAASLGVELSQRERRTIDHVPTHNLEAQDFFLRAEYQTTGLSEADSLRRALTAYRRAFELDPEFAEAYAGYARAAATVWHHDISEIMSSAVAKHEAYQAAGKAMQIDPENARAYEVLSTIQAVEGEHDLAVRSARLAVAFQPGNA